MNVALLLFLRSESRERRRAAGETRRLAAEVAGRRTAEHAMRASERRFREVFEASPTGLLMVDAQGRIALANPEVERLFGYGRGELLDRLIDDLVPDALRGAHAAQRSAYLRDPDRRHVAPRPGRDLHGRRRDGSRIPLELSLNPIGREGETTVLAAVVDLSARQAQQDLLASALREKTVLLDEVHHRVKNNLQVITSLLSLQARGASPDARAALADCRNRVHAMALTHQLLHEHGDVARLHVGEYLQRLGALLADSHRGAAPAVTLRVEGAGTALYLGLPRAIPCGLLVNELVGNAFRHAFPGGRAGTVTVALSLHDGTARLTVRDDGVGLPAGFELGDARSLGFQLVPLLVDQLGATVVHVPGTGTCFRIDFPADPKAAA
jgi:PAS domain S-box-containing protein